MNLIDATVHGRIQCTVIAHISITDTIQNKSQDEIVQLMQMIRKNAGKNAMVFKRLLYLDFMYL